MRCASPPWHTAREYLSKLQNEEDERDDRRGVTGGSDEEEGDEEGDEEDEDEGARTLDAAARSQRLADRLQHDVAQVLSGCQCSSAVAGGA